MGPTFPAAGLATFPTIFVGVLSAEVVGDKTLYSLGALSVRYRPSHLLCGAGVAVALKMLVAVALGAVLGRLPPTAVTLASAITFFCLAISLWRSKNSTDSPESRPAAWHHGALAAFASLALTEWGDPGQLAAAVFAANSDSRWLVWAAASTAMFTKVVFAVFLGTGLRKWVPVRIGRLVAVGMYALMGLMMLFQVEV